MEATNKFAQHLTSVLYSNILNLWVLNVYCYIKAFSHTMLFFLRNGPRLMIAVSTHCTIPCIDRGRLYSPPSHWAPSHWSPVSLVPHLIGPPSHWSPVSLVPLSLVLVPHPTGLPSHWSPPSLVATATHFQNKQKLKFGLFWPI